jgi:hypothetical protein
MQNDMLGTYQDPDRSSRCLLGCENRPSEYLAEMVATHTDSRVARRLSAPESLGRPDAGVCDVHQGPTGWGPGVTRPPPRRSQSFVHKRVGRQLVDDVSLSLVVELGHVAADRFDVALELVEVGCDLGRCGGRLVEVGSDGPLLDLVGVRVGPVAGGFDVGHREVEVVGDSVMEVHVEPSGHPSGQGGKNDLVEALFGYDRADGFERVWRSDLAVGLGADVVQHRQLSFEPLLGVYDGVALVLDLSDVGIEDGVVEILGVGGGDQHVKLTRSGRHALMDRVHEFLAAQCLIGHDQVAPH